MSRCSCLSISLWILVLSASSLDRQHSSMVALAGCRGGRGETRSGGGTCGSPALCLHSSSRATQLRCIPAGRRAGGRGRADGQSLITAARSSAHGPPLRGEKVTQINENNKSVSSGCYRPGLALALLRKDTHLNKGLLELRQIISLYCFIDYFTKPAREHRSGSGFQPMRKWEEHGFQKPSPPPPQLSSGFLVQTHANASSHSANC